MKKALTVVLTAALLLSATLPAFAAEDSRYIPLVTEKGAFAGRIQKELPVPPEVDPPLSEGKWIEVAEDDFALDTDGAFYQRIDFGKNTDIRTKFESAQTFTFSTWIYWRGAGMKADGTYEANGDNAIIFGASGKNGHLKVVAKDTGEGGNGGLCFAGGLWGQDVFAASKTPLPTKEWAMVTATMDGTNMSLYLNGELLVSAAQSVKPSDIAFELGSVIVLGGSFFPAPTLNAVLDESGLWTYAMTAAQVAELYAATDKDRIDVDNPVPPATSDSSVPATSEKPESETSTTTKKPSEWEKGSTPMIDEPGTWGTGLKGQIFWDEKEGDTANWVKGFSGKGLDTGGHLRYNLRYAPDTVASADSMTLSTWIYWRGAGLATDTDMAENGNGVVLFGLAGANGHLKVVLKDPDQGGKGGMTFAGGLFDHDAFAASETALPTNEWAMVTVTLDGENMSLYLNGKLLAKTAQTVRPKDLGLNMVRVGSSFWGPPTLNAVLDETAFWSRALSAEEVADMYTDMTAKAPSTGVVNTTGVVMFATAAVSLAAVIALMKKKKAQF